MNKEDKITAENLKSNIGMQIAMLLHSGKDEQKVIDHIFNLATEYASDCLVVQEQSKQEVKDLKEVGKKAIDYERQVAIAGKVMADLALQFWMLGYQFSLPQEQKDKVTGVSDEEIEKLWEENSVLNNMMGQSFRLMHKEEFVKILKSLLSSKAVEQKEPVKDGFEKVLENKIAYFDRYISDIENGEYSDFKDDLRRSAMSERGDVIQILSEYQKFSPPIQEAEHKQGVTDLEKFASWLGQHRAEFYSRCGYAIIDNKRTEGISPKGLVELFLRSLFGEKGKEAKDE